VLSLSHDQGALGLFQNNDSRLFGPQSLLFTKLTATAPSKITLIGEKRQRVIGGLILLIVLSLHLWLGFWLLPSEQKPVVPPQPTLIEVALLVAPKPVAPTPVTPTPLVAPPPPAVVVPPVPVVTAPAPPKPLPPKPKPVRPKVKPVPPVPKQKPVVKPKPQPEPAVVTKTPLQLPSALTLPTTPALIAAETTTPTPAAPNPAALAKTNERIICLACPQPPYPMMAKRHHWQGSVTLSLRLASDGSVAQVQVLSSSAQTVLDEAAVKSAKHWRFNRSLSNSDRVATQVIHFTLNNN